MRRKSPPVLTPLLLTLVLLNQAPASPPDRPPITVLIAPPDTAGRARARRGVRPGARRRAGPLQGPHGDPDEGLACASCRPPSAGRCCKCKRTELRCLTALGEAAKSEVVLVAELLQRMDGYRVGTKIYKTVDGGLVAENLMSGVREDGMLDALTQSLEVVVPQLRQKLRPSPPRPLGSEACTPDGPEDPTGPTSNAPRTRRTPPSNAPRIRWTTTVERPEDPAGPTIGGPQVAQRAPRSPRSSSLRRWAWAPAAVGVASAGAGTFFLLQARSKYNKLDEGSRRAGQDAAQLAKDGQQGPDAEPDHLRRGRGRARDGGRVLSVSWR